MEMTRIEAAHLMGLVGQFLEVLDASAPGDSTDPAVARLTPDAYPEDADASAEFRTMTQSELLDRRASDARSVLAQLALAGADPDGLTDDNALDTVALPLTVDDASAWLRALASLRLVLAERLGVSSEDDHDEDDQRFAIYDWLGYRLDALVQEIDALDD
ncbi:DUF2017 family protein [Microbacterium sp. ASV49]|uniref:DUF2017 family protein n=1 Tax=Microbacterium candidum TaxID=3041922 RepID=A0ABT7N459_9MICO|nr:DUF2017 family protein [Microbacterium sp. ASV49]MDL9981465.1 DUF2017 family protein [Microbacterium sp. ASV49]